MVFVIPFNKVIEEISQKHECKFVDTYYSFVYGNGEVVSGFQHRDGIHLMNNGTSTLLKAVHRDKPVIRDPTVNSGPRSGPFLTNASTRSLH